jgi:hypothetical protein
MQKAATQVTERGKPGQKVTAKIRSATASEQKTQKAAAKAGPGSTITNVGQIPSPMGYVVSTNPTYISNGKEYDTGNGGSTVYKDVAQKAISSPQAVAERDAVVLAYFKSHNLTSSPTVSAATAIENIAGQTYETAYKNGKFYAYLKLQNGNTAIWDVTLNSSNQVIQATKVEDPIVNPTTTKGK